MMKTMIPMYQNESGVCDILWIQQLSSKLTRNEVRIFENNQMKTVFFVNSQNWRQTTVVFGSDC